MISEHGVTTRDRVRSAMEGARQLMPLMLVNSPFVLAHPAGSLIDSPLLQSFLVGAVVFLVPGMPLVALAQRTRWLNHPSLFWCMLASLAVFGLVLLASHAVGAGVSGTSLWHGVWIVSNCLVLVASLLKAPLQLPRILRRPIGIAEVLVFSAAYGMFFVGATRIVPALDDQDDELQGTAHSLLLNLTPGLLTARNTDYVFAHPPLAHLYVAQTLAYNGLLDSLSAFNPATPDRLPRDSVYQRYLDRPYHLETRTSSVWLSAATVLLLFAWIGAAARSRAVGALAAFTYAALPEVFVRSSYAGYYALGAYVTAHLLHAADLHERDGSGATRWYCAATGLLAALSDHKLVIIIAAILLWQCVRRCRERATAAISIWHPTVAGFAVGTALFWAYGLAISPRDFWIDHVRYHIADRILHINARGLDLSTYPGVIDLWVEFWRDTSFVVIPGGVIAAVLLARGLANDQDASVRSDVDDLHPATPWLWLLIIAGTSLAFSLVDWRQTKHLAILAVPCVIAAGAIQSRLRYRVLGAVGLAASLALSAQRLLLMAHDFSAVVKVPEW